MGPFVLIGRHPHLFEMACIVEPQIHELANFYKTDSLSIWILYRKFLKMFEIGLFWADRQNPFCQNGPQYGGPKYMSWQFFFMFPFKF